MQGNAGLASGQTQGLRDKEKRDRGEEGPAEAGPHCSGQHQAMLFFVCVPERAPVWETAAHREGVGTRVPRRDGGGAGGVEGGRKGWSEGHPDTHTLCLSFTIRTPVARTFTVEGATSLSTEPYFKVASCLLEPASGWVW